MALAETRRLDDAIAQYQKGLELSPKGYKELSRTSLFVARESWGTPALSRGLLFVCQNETGVDGTPRRVLCYDLRG